MTTSFVYINHIPQTYRSPMSAERPLAKHNRSSISHTGLSTSQTLSYLTPVPHSTPPSYPQGEILIARPDVHDDKHLRLPHPCDHVHATFQSQSILTGQLDDLLFARFCWTAPFQAKSPLDHRRNNLHTRSPARSLTLPPVLVVGCLTLYDGSRSCLCPP